MPVAATLVNFEVTGELRFSKPVTKEMYIKIKDKNMLDVFINKVVTVRTMMRRSLQEYEEQLKSAEALVNLLQTEYQQE